MFVKGVVFIQGARCLVCTAGAGDIGCLLGAPNGRCGTGDRGARATRYLFGVAAARIALVRRAAVLVAAAGHRLALSVSGDAAPAKLSNDRRLASMALYKFIFLHIGLFTSTYP